MAGMGPSSMDSPPKIQHSPPSLPPRSPLRETVLSAFNTAGGRREREMPRYQLVDEVAHGDDVPILHSPGQLRHNRARGKSG